ncbi:MAG: DUF4331 domain-containing protein [Phycisphaerae bacterium]|nr:DUF4331 domain-containing protein [Phycisphaerae bacterium]
MFQHRRRPSPRGAVRGLSFALTGAVTSVTLAASHSDAPLIKQDPQANITDVYAFIGTKYDDPGTEVLNVVVQVRPFSEPGDGPHYDRFADDARYSIHIAHPMTGEELLRYDFEFTDVNGGYKNPATILSYGLGTEAGPIQMIGDARQNYTQRYKIIRAMGGFSNTIASGVPVAPPNAGKNVTPLYNDEDGRAVSGAATLAELDPYTVMAISDLPDGEVVFAGPREDGFYADIPGVFDLLDVRILDNNGDLGDGLGQDGNGVDGFKGFNVLSYAIQIPLSMVPTNDMTLPFFGPQQGVGVYATVSRPEFRLIQKDGTVITSGDFIQVNRMGNPVFNEALVALEDKDNYNVTSPVDDAQFAVYAENSELAGLINFVYGTDFVTSGRDDLVAVFIPDVLRVVTTTGPVTLAGQDGFSRLGFIGGDLTDGISSGWPNGRRFGDDVIDVALTAVASGPSYDPIVVVGDNVAANDALYNQVFPYGGTPNAGTFNRKDPTGIVGDVNGDGQVDFVDLLTVLAAFGTGIPGG